MIASGGKHIKVLQEAVYFKVDVPKGDYQRTKGMRSQQILPKGKICGFKKFDKVLYLGNKYFIKGRMSRGGYAILMDIEGNKINFSNMPKGYKTPKLSKCSRLSARTSQMVSCRFIPTYRGGGLLGIKDK